MLTVEKLLFLRKVDLFADLPPRVLGHIAQVALEVAYPAGAIIFPAGEFGDTLFVIVNGEVTASRAGSVIATLRAADYFGEMAVLTGETRSATLTAKCDCLLLRVGQHEVHEVLAVDFRAVLSVIRTLCKRLQTNQIP
jgi:CRP-like cAMP-binding protein